MWLPGGSTAGSRRKGPLPASHPDLVCGLHTLAGKGGTGDVTREVMHFNSGSAKDRLAGCKATGGFCARKEGRAETGGRTGQGTEGVCLGGN